MAIWKRGERHRSWAKNGNVAVTIFFVLFGCWMGFQVWARYGGGTPPVGLDPMVMAALGVAITTKSVEKKAEEREVHKTVVDVQGRVWDLEELARRQHPEDADKLPPTPSDPGPEDGKSHV